MNTPAVWTIGSILNWTGQYFRDKGLDSPRLDAEVLLGYVLQQERLYLYVHFDQPLTVREQQAYKELIRKRVQGMPVAYLVGGREFMGYWFTVNSSVLIPRPDTEILVETALNKLKEIEKPHILDMGTGSGAILLSLLLKLPTAQGLGVDISPQALQVAAKNAESLGCAARVQFTDSDLFTKLPQQSFHMIVSNPPYIQDDQIAELAAEVQQEPRAALAGGVDGLDFYRRILCEAPKWLLSGGYLLLEVGADQAQAVLQLAQSMGCYCLLPVVRDYSGIERVVVIRVM